MPEKTEFLPFHAINEFMRPDFQLSIIRDTFTSISLLSESQKHNLNQKIKKYVTIPGFRNSDKAPALVKVLPSSKAFEKHPAFVAVVLSSWYETQPSLREQVYELLKKRNWKFSTADSTADDPFLSADFIKDWPILPLNIDRTKLPGFYPYWPKGEDFEALYQSYSEMYPDSDASIDKVGLMVVWITMRLPYHMENDMIDNGLA